MEDTKQPKEVAISVDHLYKDFKLPHERKNSLKEKVLFVNKKTTYDKLHALHDIDFQVEKGEFFGIVGRNGSGKSTLLKIIGGIYQPTKGSLSVNGTLTPFIELGIGFNPELTGRENIYLNGAILGLTRKEINAKYNEIVDFAELEKFMDQKLKNYSSGMQVRLAFSIAIQAHNDILLIDEVLAVGDANFQRKCFKVFREIKKSGKTVIFVTHAMEMVEEFCDRALMIQDSRVVALGDPREIALRYQLANNTTGGETDGETLKRPKNPAIKIKDVKILSKGKKTDNFSLEDDITAQVEINIKEPKDVQFNLFFVGSDGEYIAGINSLKDFAESSFTKGNYTINCNITAGQLIRDTYSVGVAIYSDEDVPEVVDIIDRAYEGGAPQITITQSSKYKNGKFYIKGKWSERKV